MPALGTACSLKPLRHATSLFTLTLESRDVLVTVATAGGEARAVQSITLSISHRRPATTKLSRGRKDGILKAHTFLKLFPVPWACGPYLSSSPPPITKGEFLDASLMDNYVYIVLSKIDDSLISECTLLVIYLADRSTLVSISCKASPPIINRR